MYGRWRFTMPTGQSAELVEASQATADDQRRALTPAAACWTLRQLGLGGVRRAPLRDEAIGSLEALGALTDAGSFWVHARRPGDGAYRDLEAAIRARHVLVLDARGPLPYVPLMHDPEEAPADWSSPPPDDDVVALVAFADIEDLLDVDCAADEDGADVDHAAEVDEEQPLEHDHDAEDEATEIEAGADADAPEPEPAPEPHENDQPAIGAASA